MLGECVCVRVLALLCQDTPSAGWRCAPITNVDCRISAPEIQEGRALGLRTCVPGSSLFSLGLRRGLLWRSQEPLRNP